MTKRTLIFIALLVALFVAGTQPAAAQTSITTTTITEPILIAAPGAITITVAATTGMTVTGILYIDGSVYRILAINSLLVQVIQQYRPATHLDNAKVYVVPTAAQIGLNPVGSCIRSTAGAFPQYSPYRLMFNLSTGDVASCRLSATAGTWRITNPYSVGAPSDDPPQTY